MVSLKDAELSNSRIASSLPAHLVAVFVGSTSGIGEHSLKAFAKYAKQPRIYFVGRSQESADRISAELRKLNAGGEYTFIKADVSLIRNVDKVCDDIKSKEKSINLLFLSPGALHMDKTEEGIVISMAVAYYARMRFVENLLPQLREATALRRVVSVYAGTKEGNVDTKTFFALRRGHSTSMMTLSLEALAKTAPDVSFIHNYPGAVMTNLIRGGEGAVIWTAAQVLKVIMPLFAISDEECGERHAFIATSARYPPASNPGINLGVPSEGGIADAKGTDGKVDSGVYTVDSHGESGDSKVVAVLAKLRREGVRDAVWEHCQSEFNRIMESKK